MVYQIVWFYAKEIKLMFPTMRKTIVQKTIHTQTHIEREVTQQKEMVAGNRRKHVHRCRAPEQHWARRSDHLAAYSALVPCASGRPLLQGSFDSFLPRAALSIYITPPPLPPQTS